MPNANGHDEPIFISAKRAAAMMEMTPRYIQNMVRAGKIPKARYFGRYIRVHREAFIKWMEQSEERRNVQSVNYVRPRQRHVGSDVQGS